jgi:3-dehydroquinate synthase
MGTGKTTIGKKIAERLGCQFFDLDQLIEQEQQKTIAEIFKESGEPFFRMLETEALGRALKWGGIIALGGGTLANANNLEKVLRQENLLVGLCCSAEEIVRRVVAEESVRPLLKNRDVNLLEHVQGMLKQRKLIYQNFDIQIDTTNLNADQVVDLIEKYSLTRMKRVCYPGGSYPIWIQRDLLDAVGDFIIIKKKVKQVVVVTNPIVAELYLQRMTQAIQKVGIEASVIMIPDGEEGKTLDTVRDIYDELTKIKADRSSMMLALGGGITGDICGFAAASYMRGISYIQVPTTLLSMVDSSIGGKTGVNIPQGKNLIGAFKQPELVIMDINTLKTLPEKELLNGFGEFLKHGLIADYSLFEQLIQFEGTLGQLITCPAFEEMFEKSLSVKRNLVQIDPYEMNERMLLNFGHTLGHALEKASAYRIAHGEAVIIGMWFAVVLSNEMGYLSDEQKQEIDQLYRKFSLPRSLDTFSTQELMNYIGMDKKKKANEYRWVLLRHIGDAFIHTFESMEKIELLIKQSGAKV